MIMKVFKMIWAWHGSKNYECDYDDDNKRLTMIF